MTSISSVTISIASGKALSSVSNAPTATREAVQAQSTTADQVALASQTSAQENASKPERLGKERIFQQPKRAEGTDLTRDDNGESETSKESQTKDVKENRPRLSKIV